MLGTRPLSRAKPECSVPPPLILHFNHCECDGQTDGRRGRRTDVIIQNVALHYVAAIERRKTQHSDNSWSCRCRLVREHLLRAPVYVYQLVNGSIVVQWSASVGGSQGMHHSTRIHANSADRTSSASQFRPERRKSICARRACMSLGERNQSTDERLGERGVRISMRSATPLPAICCDPVTHCCFAALSRVGHGPPSNLLGGPYT